MDVLLLRHAPTAGNLERRYIGCTDEPLCPEGIARACAWAMEAALGPSGAPAGQKDAAMALSDEVHTLLASPPKVYVSRLTRCAQTAELCFPGAALEVVEGLHEMNFGDFEGRSADEMIDDASYRAWVDTGCTGRCPHGEDQADFDARVQAAFEGLLTAGHKRGEKAMVVVAHGGTLMAVMSRWGGDAAVPYYGWHVPHLGGYVLHALFQDVGTGYHAGACSVSDSDVGDRRGAGPGASTFRLVGRSRLNG
ncbi:MAG: histidine phosphatase family protein [Coriobacteriales bacterium]|jgi:alpha-ribazole phosphatase|nr:histidine phosphatase family protein [Coriobacteriales bacterium]